MPQPKKHPSTRARRNKASTAATLTASGERTPAEVPELPDRDAGWHPLTVQWWADVWASPMSDEWHPSTDLHNVYAAAMHYDDMWRAETPAERQKADAAFQKREAALGLTPYDRRRLEWTIESAEEAKDRGSRRRSSAQSTTAPAPTPGKVDPRSVFSVVS